MMKKWIRLSALVLLFSLCLMALASCQNVTPPDGDTDVPDTEDQTPDQNPDQDDTADPNKPEKPEYVIDPNRAMMLVEGGKTDYVIVLDDAASNETKMLVEDFRNRFLIKTGVNIQTRKDTGTETAKEIIISMMDGRAQPEKEYAKLTAPQGKGYRVCTSGQSVVVACQEEYLKDALDLLLMAICDCGDGRWGVPGDYEGELDIPTISGTGKLYNVGEGNYAYNVTNATDKIVNSFLSALSNDGFDTYDQHTIGESKFATYVKDSIFGQMVVYTMYHPDVHQFRLTYGPMEYLPNATPIKADTKAEPTITQMFMEMVYGSDKLTVSGNTITDNQNAPGMSYVIQLSDGRFIVIDGGSSDGDVRTVTYNETTGQWTISTTTHKSSDAKRLYDTMNAMKPASHAKPQIAVWFLSHAHADHWNLAQDFLTAYKNKIELELLAFNFPEEKGGQLLASRVERINKFKATAQNDYGADIWIMHTGQVMELPGASVEVLSTVEDYFCEGMTVGLTKEIDINNTCSVIRVNIGELSFVVLGDAYPTTCQFMADAYGDALQSDIMQLSHHGYNGAVIDLYQAIDPKICLWPCDEYAFRTDSVRMGTQTGTYKFNWWLRNKPWTRGTETGTRIHYATSYTTTLDAKTGKVISKG